MKFQFQSDIHLEVGAQYDTYKITPTAPYLILAGDIGNLNQYEAYVSFLRIQCQNFKKVFLGLGNHEFYNDTRTNGIELAERMTQEDGCKGKLFLLHRQRFDLDDDDDDDAKTSNASKVTILGCTLNSKIAEENALMVRMKVHDFSKITNWTVETHNTEHEQDLSWLKQQIHDLQGTSRKILVVTHHAPFRHGCSKPQYEANTWHDAFATALLEPERDGDGTPNILRQADTWIFGHTHYTTECTVGGVRCVANQRGYVFPWQQGKPAEPDSESVAASEPGVVALDKPTFWSKIGGLVKRNLPAEKKQSSFKVNYPGPTKGHEGDGLIPFDPLRYLEI